MEHISSYIKGLDLDTSFHEISQDSYLFMSGGTIVTQKGSSTADLETEKGLKHLFSFPSVPDIFKFRIFGTIENNVLTITYNNTPYAISLLNVLSNEELYTIIINYVQNFPLQFNIIVNYSKEFDNITIRPANNDENLNVAFSNNTNIEFKKVLKQKGLTIIGSGINQDSLVIATCSSVNVTSNGQLWKIKIDPVTKQVLLNNGTLLGFGEDLLVSDHLLYSEELNLSLDYYITKLICSPETPTVNRVYFNDTNNPLRSININVDYVMNYPLLLLENSNIVSFPEVVVDSIIDGGFISVGSVVQYFYRFRGISAGNITSINVGGLPIKLTADNPIGDVYNATYKGSEYLESENSLQENFYKSIKLNFRNLDTNYSFIELFFVQYNHLDLPSVYKVAELEIPFSGILTYIHDGNPDNFVEFNSLEINKTVFNIRKLNDIVVKDNRLIGLGATLSNTELNWDTRAYRFNNQGQAILKSTIDPNYALNATALNFQEQLVNVPLEHDAINDYNDDSETQDWELNRQYKFQSNGSILGGEGPNISFEFVTYSIKAEEDTTINRSSPPFVYSGRFPSGATIDLGKDRVYDVSNEFRDFRSPKVDSIIKGYARGEIYRIGFQAFDLKSNPYYNNWVCDIRMPEEWDISGTLISGIPPFSAVPVYGLNTQSTINFLIGNKLTNDEVKLNSLGLRFTLKNLDQIRDRVSGYCFTMVKRDQANKTKVAHGVFIPMIQGEERIDEDDIDDTQEYVSEPVIPTSTRIFRTAEDGNPGNVVRYVIFPITNANSPTAITPKSFISFRSLDDMIFDSTFKYASTDFLQQSSLYNCTEQLIQRTDGNGPYAMKYLAYTFVNIFRNTQRLPLTDSKWKESDMSLKVQDFNTLEGISLTPDFYKAIQPNDFRKAHYYLLGSLRINTERNWIHIRNRICLSESKLNYNTVINGAITNNNSFDVATNPEHLILGSYRKKLVNQYGGNRFSDRQRSLHHPITPFIKLDNSNITTDVVFGGDVCVTYYPFRTINATRAVGTALGIGGFDRANFVPHLITESEVNPYYNIKQSWLLDEYTPAQADTNDQAIGYDPNSYFGYNKVYLQKNTIKIYSPKPTLVVDNNFYPAGIFVSDVKLNGDRVDSWQVFKFDQYKEVDNIFGAIKAGALFRDQLVFLQERAIGIQSINERALQFNDETGTQIVLGNGDIVGEHGYVSKNSGTIHNSSVFSTDAALYYYDGKLNKIRQYTGEGIYPLSDMLSISSHLFNNFNYSQIRNTNKPLLGIGVTSSYDFLNKRLYMTFLDSNIKSTICFNENMNRVESFPPYSPFIYLSNFSDLLSENPLDRNQVYIHNEGDYNTYYNGIKSPLVIKIVVNTPKELHTVLDNVQWTSEAFNNNNNYVSESFNSIRVYNNYQDTGYKSSIKKVLRIWTTKVGFDLGTKARMRNSYHIVELVFNNNNNSRLIIHKIISTLRISFNAL
jgi:hypothetical protein